MPRFTHDFDLLASITCEHENFEDIPKAELIAAMKKRLESLTEGDEAFGHVGTEEDEDDDEEENEEDLCECGRENRECAIRDDPDGGHRDAN